MHFTQSKNTGRELGRCRRRGASKGIEVRDLGWGQ
jgi:hypothetical protein